MGTYSKDPPQADYRATLSQLVLRLKTASDLAKQRGDPALVSLIRSALVSAEELLDQPPRPATSARSKTWLMADGLRAVKYIVDLVESLHTFFNYLRTREGSYASRANYKDVAYGRRNGAERLGRPARGESVLSFAGREREKNARPAIFADGCQVF